MVSKDTSSAILDKLLQEQDNMKCFDCGNSSVEWASVNHGIFLCSNCAGIHRGLGAHISFVRSLDIDEWTLPQLKLMSSGGNLALRQFFNSYSFPDNSIYFVYRTRAASYYRAMVKSISEGNIFQDEQPSMEDGVLLESNLYSDEPSSTGIGAFFRKAINTSKEKYNEFRNKPSVMSFEEKTSGFLSKVKHKTQELAQAPALQKVKDGTLMTYDYVADKTNSAYQTLKQKVKKDHSEEIPLEEMKGDN